MPLDPDVAALLGALLAACGLAAGGSWRARGVRRRAARACAVCGRLVRHGVPTCDCEP